MKSSSPLYWVYSISIGQWRCVIPIHVSEHSETPNSIPNSESHDLMNSVHLILMVIKVQLVVLPYINVVSVSCIVFVAIWIVCTGLEKELKTSQLVFTGNCLLLLMVMKIFVVQSKIERYLGKSFVKKTFNWKIAMLKIRKWSIIFSANAFLKPALGNQPSYIFIADLK